ncbi:hypothetical protein [Azospirillum doebereinerae]
MVDARRRDNRTRRPRRKRGHCDWLSATAAGAAQHTFRGRAKG